MSFVEPRQIHLAVDEKENEIQKAKTQTNSGQESKREPTILCLLDHSLGNLMIHYARTTVIHPKQGFDDILELVREEDLLSKNIKLIYLLVGRPDMFSAPLSSIRSAEKLPEGFAKMQPKIMVVVGAVLVLPWDTPWEKAEILELNQKLWNVAEKDHNWVFFNLNICVSLAGEPQK